MNRAQRRQMARRVGRSTKGREPTREFWQGWRALIFDPTPVALADGTTGYRMERSDDCFRAALATVLQLAPSAVPDLWLQARVNAGEPVDAINRSADELVTGWLAENGIDAARHHPPPWDHPRWIGVVPPPGQVWASAPFASHCLVMRGREVLHDPYGVTPYAVSQGIIPAKWQGSDVQYGFTFDRTTKKAR